MLVVLTAMAMLLMYEVAAGVCGRLRRAVFRAIGYQGLLSYSASVPYMYGLWSAFVLHLAKYLMCHDLLTQAYAFYAGMGLLGLAVLCVCICCCFCKSCALYKWNSSRKLQKATDRTCTFMHSMHMYTCSSSYISYRSASADA